MNSSITLSRDSGYADRLRSYQVIVDGQKFGYIKNGETKTFLVESGKHELSLKIDWCGSNTIPFTLPTNHSVVFECGSSLRGIRILLAIFYILFAWKKYLWLKQTNI